MTWDPSRISPQARLHNDNKEVRFRPDSSVSCNAGVMATYPMRPGSVYAWEISATSVGGTSTETGVCFGTSRLHVDSYMGLFGRDEQSWVIDADGKLWHNGKSTAAGFTLGTDSKLLFTLDLVKNILRIKKGSSVIEERLPHITQPLFVCAASTLMSASITLSAFAAQEVPDVPPKPTVALFPSRELAPLSRFSALSVIEVIHASLLLGDKHLHELLAAAVSGLSPELDGGLSCTSTAGGAGAPRTASTVDLLQHIVATLEPHAAVSSMLFDALIARCVVIFRLHVQLVTKHIAFSATVNVMSKLHAVIVEFATDAFTMPLQRVDELQAALHTEAVSLAHEMFDSQLVQLAPCLVRYMLTPSVLATFSPEFVELRAALQYCVSMCTADSVTAAQTSTLRASLERMWQGCMNEVMLNALTAASEASTASFAVRALFGVLTRIKDVATIELFHGLSSLAAMIPAVMRAAFTKLEQACSASLAERIAFSLGRCLDGSVDPNDFAGDASILSGEACCIMLFAFAPYPHCACP